MSETGAESIAPADFVDPRPVVPGVFMARRSRFEKGTDLCPWRIALHVMSISGGTSTQPMTTAGGARGDGGDRLSQFRMPGNDEEEGPVVVNRNERQAEFVIQARVLKPAEPDQEDLPAQDERASVVVNVHTGRANTRRSVRGDIGGGLSL